MQTLSLLFFLSSIIIGVFSDPSVFLPAVDFGGLNVIFSNDTSFLDDIDSHGDTVYISGEGIVREVIENPFSLETNPRFFNQAHRFIDFKAFNDTNNNAWVFGPITSHHVPNSMGYVAGWAMQGSTINFVISRLTVTPNTATDNNIFTSEAPVTLNTTSGYEDFYRTFKPKIFRNGAQSYVIVVDPSSRCIYKISTSGDDTSSPAGLTLMGSVHVAGRFGGVTYDPEKETVYVALVAVGTNPGSIVAVSTVGTTPSIISTTLLSQYQSNPSALHVKDGALYIGFTGGHAIIKADINNPIPYFLRNIAAIHARHSGDVYFVTSDQFAKIVKIDQEQFCDTTCDAHYGFCSNEKCQCADGTISDDGITCNITKDNSSSSLIPKYNNSHAGEIALGLLFAVSLITAIIGWVLLWKTRKHNSNNNSRYSTLSHGEHESFLSDEDEP